MRSTLHKNIDDLTPVIVGIGQLLDRPAISEDGLEPLSLIIKALEIADSDSGYHFLKKVDSIDIENITSRDYEDISTLISQRLDLHPERCVYHPVSGDLPIKHLCEAANRIANGSSKIAVICGGESAWSAARAKKRNINLDSWIGKPKSSASWIPAVDTIVRKYQLHLPVRAYALYENACRSKWQQSFGEAQLESGIIQSRASEIAARNEFSWTKTIKNAEEIILPSEKNKLIAWPYTKLMVANNNLNSGTAIILTNLRLALENGINPEKLIYLHAGGYASEPDNILLRDNYYHSSAMEAVFDRLMTANNISIPEIGFCEIYSCFPCVTKIAKRIINPANNQDLTVAGGMTFCRGQLSNYMSQALACMVSKLRVEGKDGLLYGNGHYLTHAAGIVISKLPPQTQSLPINLNLQNEANSRMSAIPELIEHYQGPGIIETYTVVFGKENQPLYAIIVGRTPENKRFVALTTPGESNEVLTLLNPNIDPVGMRGRSCIRDGYNIWSW